MEEDPEERWAFAMGLYGISSTEASNGAQLKGDSSGGYSHLNNLDPSFYTGLIQTMPVAGSDTTQSQGWMLKTKNSKNSQMELTVTWEEGRRWRLDSLPSRHLKRTLRKSGSLRRPRRPQKEPTKQLDTAIIGSQAYIVPTRALVADDVPIYDYNLAFSWAVPCPTTVIAIFVNLERNQALTDL
ncbi:hypothetical protein FRC01_003788, partial [Tulasnella sp. 417]